MHLEIKHELFSPEIPLLLRLLLTTNERVVTSGQVANVNDTQPNHFFLEAAISPRIKVD